MSEIEQTLHEVIERLAALDRTPCSPGEREAAVWLAERFAATGAAVSVEEEPSWGTFPPTATCLGLGGLLAAALALRGRRVAAAVLAAVGTAGVIDEAENGPRLLRRLVRRRKQTVNVVATLGDPAGERTLVVLAHHDAAQSGVVFDQTLQRTLFERAPGLMADAKTSFPHWWIGMACPLGAIASAVTGRRGPARVGLIAGALATSLIADVWRNPTVPGANDNLSGVAVLVALAELLREQPLPGLRVLLVSCGAEETLQDGVRAFLQRHRDRLDPARTVFVNLDTVGSPSLVMIEGEGPFRMADYTGPWLREMVADCAQRLGIELDRGYRARVSTDSVIPSRAGYPTATLGSLTSWRSPANYHQPSDIPANLDYGTIADATLLVRGLLDELVPGGAGLPGLTGRQAGSGGDMAVAS